MPDLKDRMCLYHGSFCEVKVPDLSKCARYKDFGQGFYLTSSREQAVSFSRISTAKAIGRGLIPPQHHGVINTYSFVNPGDLKVLDYPTAEVEWLHCVVAHRRNRFFPDVIHDLQNYDIVSGKIANDNTNVTITAYLDGLYGEIGSESADRICISLLLPERLRDQFCFRTDKALSALHFEGGESVWL